VEGIGAIVLSQDVRTAAVCDEVMMVTDDEAFRIP